MEPNPLLQLIEHGQSYWLDNLTRGKLADGEIERRVRDEGLLDSALARPANRHLYEGLTDLSALAATYLAAVAGNHPFLDGNKRAGFIAMGLFLAKNGLIFTADETDAALKVFAFAAGEIGVEDLTVWIAGNVEPA